MVYSLSQRVNLLIIESLLNRSFVNLEGIRHSLLDILSADSLSSPEKSVFDI